MENNKNILIATFLSMIVLIGWTWFIEKPRLEKKEALKKEYLAKQRQVAKEISKKGVNRVSSTYSKQYSSAPNSKDSRPVVIALQSREQILKDTSDDRIIIENDSLHGSIYLKGAKFDDITLANYFQTIKKNKEVVLFAPVNSKQRYFADFGWVSSNENITLPNLDTIWRSNSKTLTPENPVILYWKNRQGIKFEIEVSLDDNFMFDIQQKVINNSRKNITIANYGRVNRALNNLGQQNYILHEGFIGAFDGVLEESTYKDVVDDRVFRFKSSGSTWQGITDKYWLSSMIADSNLDYNSTFSHKINNGNNIFNSEFVSQEFIVKPRSEISFSHKLFVGAKKVKVIDEYSSNFDIDLFDRAIDFGWFYFLTKPFFFAIDFIYNLVGNFGAAILIFTVIIKALLFPMANKSYKAIARMKGLAPKVTDIKEKFKDDRMEMNRQIMEVYKREKVNPAAGCLPVLLQIPVFFALYKVIFVTIDMRHAPFFGWIKDLSAPDPTSIFNLFGLLPFEVAGMLAVGVWPILMGVTMIIQQKLSPPVSDPTQAKVMKLLPYFLAFILASFPAGLVIYWTWNNLLSVLQQLYINRLVARLSKERK
jgi:YidC/Oxa1 family membrane protein insertase